MWIGHVMADMEGHNKGSISEAASYIFSSQVVNEL